MFITTFFPIRGQLLLIAAGVLGLSSALEFKGHIFKMALLQLPVGGTVLQTHFLVAIRYMRVLNLMQI